MTDSAETEKVSQVFPGLEEMLPLLRCPVSYGSLDYNAATNTLKSGEREYSLDHQVIHLNPHPTDEDLNEYYEKVNAKKLSKPEDVEQQYQRVYDTNVFERYYLKSRMKGLQKILPDQLGTVLDIGGGGGELFRFLLRHIDKKPDRVLLMDWAAAQMHAIAPHIADQTFAYVQADALNLPLHDNVADTIFNSEMIEHLVPDQSQKMVKEFFRVLKPGGHLMITTPNGDEYRRFIQENMLKVIMWINNEDYRDLKSREKVKSKLLRPYLKMTGHHFVNIDAAEKAGQIGHFNVLSRANLQSQMKEAGFEIEVHHLAIFIPFILPGFLKNIDAVESILNVMETSTRAVGMGGLSLACQMYLAKKPIN